MDIDLNYVLNNWIINTLVTSNIVKVILSLKDKMHPKLFDEAFL